MSGALASAVVAKSLGFTELIVAHEEIIVCGSWNISWDILAAAIHEARIPELTPIRSSDIDVYDGGTAYVGYTAAWGLMC